MAESGPTPSPRPRRSIGGRLLLFTLLVFGLVLGVMALFTWAALKFSYADGERAGYIQKFSRRGWLCKTWEGELAMANLPGTMPQIFLFSVRDPKIADSLNQAIGQRVALHYEQHKALPTDCFGETEYFITQVRILDGRPGAAPPPR